MIQTETKTGDSQKQQGHSKRGFNRTPQTQLPVSNHLLSEDVSTTKTNQKISPIVNDEEPSQQMTTEQFYPGRAFIPLIEEEDHDGYEDPYSIANHNNQHQLPQAKTVMSHQYPNLPGDSSSRSSPFQKNSKPVPKTQPVISLGFSSLAEQVVKRKVNHQREEED